MRWLRYSLVLLFCLPFFYHPTVILSSSMEPTLSVASLAIVKRDAVPQVGSIIYAQLPGDSGEHFTHRVTGWRVDDSGIVLQTKGDAQANGDAWKTHLSSSEGVVVASLPKLGAPVLWLRTTISRYVL